MKTDLDLKSTVKKARLFIKNNAKHSSFVAILIVLLCYIFLVSQISSLSTAEPAESDSTAAKNNFPHIDQKAIGQIQALEQSNTQIHALFNSARNNPFQE